MDLCGSLFQVFFTSTFLLLPNLPNLPGSTTRFGTLDAWAWELKASSWQTNGWHTYVHYIYKYYVMCLKIPLHSFGKCCSGRIEIDLLEDILDSKMIPFKRLKSLNCENLPVMFEGTNLDKPKPSVQNTRAANLQGDSKLARFTHLKNLNLREKKQRDQMCLHLKGVPNDFVGKYRKSRHRKENSLLRFGVAQKCWIRPRQCQWFHPWAKVMGIFVACCSQVRQRYSKFHVGNASKPQWLLA